MMALITRKATNIPTTYSEIGYSRYFRETSNLLNIEALRFVIPDITSSSYVFQLFVIFR